MVGWIKITDKANMKNLQKKRFRKNAVGSCAAFSVLLVAACSVLVRAQDAPQISVRAERESAIYKQGEEVTFIVRLTAGVLPAGEVQWKLSKDNFATISEGKATLENGAAKITGKLDEPGFLQCRVSYGKEFKLAGAGVDPLLIKPSLPVPGDFDAFWNAQKKRLAEVPMNARLTPVEKFTNEKIETFDLKADAIGETPVSGYYARPRGAVAKSLPAILTLQGAGVRSAYPSAQWANQNMISLDINAHGIVNGESAEYYQKLNHEKLFGYQHFGRESREETYFLNMFLRMLRAIDFLTSQPEWDGKTLIVYGTSQGGYQAITAAALDARVSYFVAGVSAGCDHSGMMTNRISGWPKWVKVGEDGKPDEKMLQAARYFDTMNFATRVKVPGFLTVGFIDTTCPPTSVYAMYNNLHSAKEIFNDIGAKHENTPEAMKRMMAAIAAHVAKQKN
jgi:cephalosporin-C deacetylase-like acetyl esterase